ncbi:Cytochrome b2, mitochondrial [Metarhizium anisopliae]
MAKLFDAAEVAKHNTPESCWVVLYGNVYDVTDFLTSHPGGSRIILKLAGQDATEDYDPIHPPGTLEENLKPEAKLGQINPETLPEPESTPETEMPSDDYRPPLESLLNLDEIEQEATKRISKKAWAYYFSASDDLITKTFNNSVYRDILLRPRMLVDCTECDLSTTLLGNKVGVPFFVAPAAMARLAHPDGEHGIAKAAARFNALQVISNNASMTPEQIVDGAPSEQMFGWQIYLFFGTACDLTWKTTLPWLAQHTDLPIVLKGIQTHEDAYLAAQHAPQVKAIILSNHGGRAMDTAPPAVHTLLEIRKYCPEIFSKIEVWVDGGIRRGTDVVKALCLGAKAVGLGRAALFGLGAGGQAGVERTLESKWLFEN